MKRGDSYSVRYKYKDHSGKPCEGWEGFKTKKEAQERKITVEKELLDGSFLVPDSMTVEEMLCKWIPIATYQLLQSEGDFKSVQGNTGHATAAVLMDTYAHTQDKPRLELANFYSQDLTPAAPQQPPESKQPESTKITGKVILVAIRLMDAAYSGNVQIVCRKCAATFLHK